MLCGIFAINSLDDVLGLMSSQFGSEQCQVLMGFQSTEALDRLHHSSSRPAQRHCRVSPSLCWSPARGGHPQRQTVRALQRAVLLADLRRARRSLRLQGMDEPPGGCAPDAGAKDCGHGRHRHEIVDLHHRPERDPVRLDKRQPGRCDEGAGTLTRSFSSISRFRFQAAYAASHHDEPEPAAGH